MTSAGAARPTAVRQAVVYVAAAALLYSLVPLAVDVLGSSEMPFVVGAGITVGYALFTEVARRRSVTRFAATRSDVLARLRSDAVPTGGVVALFGLSALNAFDFLFFAWSTSFIDTAASSSIYEMWPLTWFAGMVLVDRRRSHGATPTSLSPTTAGLMFLAASGIALIVYSTDTADSTGISAGDSGISVLGIVLALLAPLLGGMATLHFLLADRVVHGKTPGSQNTWAVVADGNASDAGAQESLCHAAQALSHFIAAPVVFAVAIAEQGTLAVLWSPAFLGGVLCGGLLSGPAGALIRRAHIVSTHREVITLQYLAPVLALGWLAIFTEIDIGRPDFLILGTVTLVAINMLMNVDPEAAADPMPDAAAASAAAVGAGWVEPDAQPVLRVAGERHSLRALVVAMLAAGAFILFRPEIVDDARLMWTPGDYWAALAVASTVFALLLAFRLTRVETLLVAEDQRTLSLVRSIEMLPAEWFDDTSRPTSRSYLLAWVRRLNASRTLDDYRRSYNQAHKALTDVIDRRTAGGQAFTSEERVELAAIRADLDGLAVGRQQAREFAERVALWLVGAAVIGLAAAIPAQPAPWARLAADFLAVTLASVVVYLLAHLADLRRSRGDQILVAHDPDTAAGSGSGWKHFPAGLYVRFRDQTDNTLQRLFAAAVVTGIAAAVVGLLAYSRLDW